MAHEELHEAGKRLGKPTRERGAGLADWRYL